MIDGNNTTLDWQKHRGEICVLPIGSLEQHSFHLPLATDIITAEFFARMVAEELDAALLPALPLGTCLEHSGFRGSISLRPETLMQIIRDVAEEVERQNFRILVILNGHGGNFALGPVVRDLNRQDRPLKILLIGALDLVDPAIASNSRSPGLDIHSGESETSVMLAIRPELVRPGAVDRVTLPDEVVPLRQPDLNTFGMGHFSSSGVIGYPSCATAEKGSEMIASVRERLLAHLRDRISLLRQDWNYSGAGGIAVRTMDREDISEGLRLKTLAGWNQTEEDWRIFLEASPNGCFAAVHNGKVIGTVTAIRYGEVAWIGMALVDPMFRRKGIGTLLLKEALNSLEGCPTVKLDATPLGKGLYQKLGFMEEYPLQRMVRPCLPVVSQAVPPEVAPITGELWSEITALDRQVFGADRSWLLKALEKNTPSLSLIQEGKVRGYCLGRPGAIFHHIGPLVAETMEDARILLVAALQRLPGCPVTLDVPESQPEFLNWLNVLGFTVQRPLLRMFRGPNNSPGILAYQWAILGPEFG